MMLDLYYGLFTFQLAFESAAEAQRLDGPSFRGAFGNRLRHLSCATSLPECGGCPVLSWCPYYEIFETPNSGSAARLRGAARAPHPFVLKTPIARGSTVDVEMAIVGAGLRHLPLIAQAVSRMGEGCTRDRVRFSVERIVARPAGSGPVALLGHTEVKASPIVRLRDIAQGMAGWTAERGRLAFLSPTLLRSGGEAIRRISWQVFFERLLHRLEVLGSTWCGVSLDDDERRRVREVASGVTVLEDRTRWWSGARPSSRQRRDVPLEGLVGEWEIAGDLDPLLPYLIAGQHLGIGKNTSCGGGEYALLDLWGGVDDDRPRGESGIAAGGNGSFVAASPVPAPS